MFSFTTRRKQPQQHRRGFSLLELMISIGIVMLVTGIAIVRHSSFTNSLLLTNQAYEVALDIRQAQSFGISVQAGGIGEDVNRDPIGIHFDIDADSQIYTLFRDSRDSGSLGVLDSGEAIGEYSLDSRFEVSEICVSSSNCNPTEATVTFARPNLDAQLTADGVSASELHLVVQPVSGGAVKKRVIIQQSGLISVQ